MFPLPLLNRPRLEKSIEEVKPAELHRLFREFGPRLPERRPESANRRGEERERKTFTRVHPPCMRVCTQIESERKRKREREGESRFVFPIFPHQDF